MSTERDTLTSILTDQASRAALHDVTLDGVLGRARTIRRRRRIASGVAAATLIAVVAPVAWLAGDNLFSADQTLGPADGGTEIVDSAGEENSTQDANGDAPATLGVAYFDSATQTVHRADGSTVTVDMNAQVFGFASLSDGRLIFIAAQDVRDAPPVASVAIFDADGNPAGPLYEAWGYRLAVSPDSGKVAWIGTGGAPQILQVGRAEPVTLPITAGAEQGAEPLSVVGDDCHTERSEPGGCEVVVRPSDGASEVAFSWGDKDWFADAALAVGPDGDTFVGITELTDETICVELNARSQFGAESLATPFAETCGYNWFSFSPDGSLIAAQYGEGYGPTRTVILHTETLEVAASVSEPGATYHHAVWEDDDHVLLLVDYDQRGLEQGEYEVQRLGVNGDHEKLGISGTVTLASR